MQYFFRDINSTINLFNFKNLFRLIDQQCCFFYLAEFDDKISPSGTISDKRYNPHESLIVNYLENVHEERKFYFEDVSNVGFQDCMVEQSVCNKSNF